MENTCHYGRLDPHNFPHRLLLWIRANKKQLLEYYVPDSCDTSKGQAKFGELRDRLFGFERLYRGEQQILSGAAPLPSEIYKGHSRRAAESCLQFILDMQALLEGPLWDSFYSLPGLMQDEFTPLTWKHLQHNRLPQWTKAWPHAVVSLDKVDKIEFTLNNGKASKTFVEKLDYPSTAGLPLEEQIEFLNAYGAKIRDLIRTKLKDPANWPTDKEAEQAETDTARNKTMAAIARARSLANTAFLHLSPADKALLLQYPQAINDVLKGV